MTGVQTCALPICIGADHPETLALQTLDRDRKVGKLRDGHVLNGARRRRGDHRAESCGTMARNDHAVHPCGLRRPKDRAKIPGIFNAIEQQEKGRLSPLAALLEYIVEIHDRMGRRVRDDALRGAGPGEAIEDGRINFLDGNPAAPRLADEIVHSPARRACARNNEFAQRPTGPQGFQNGMPALDLNLGPG